MNKEIIYDCIFEAKKLAHPYQSGLSAQDVKEINAYHAGLQNLIEIFRKKRVFEMTSYMDAEGEDIFFNDIVRVKNCGCGKEDCKKFSGLFREVTHGPHGIVFPFGDQMQGDTYRDSRNYLNLGPVGYSPDGNAIMAFLKNSFINIQESPCGFGSNEQEALKDLMSALEK